jgi:hypothetical protein
MQEGAALQHITAVQSDIVGTHRGFVRHCFVECELVSACRSLLICRWGRCCRNKTAAQNEGMMKMSGTVWPALGLEAHAGTSSYAGGGGAAGTKQQ